MFTPLAFHCAGAARRARKRPADQFPNDQLALKLDDRHLRMVPGTTTASTAATRNAQTLLRPGYTPTTLNGSTPESEAPRSVECHQRPDSVHLVAEFRVEAMQSFERDWFKAPGGG